MSFTDTRASTDAFRTSHIFTMFFQSVMHEALREHVAKGKRSDLRIHPVLATFVVLLVFLSLTFIAILLLWLQLPSERFNVALHEFLPDVDLATRMSQCGSVRDATQYPQNSLRIAFLHGVDQVATHSGMTFTYECSKVMEPGIFNRFSYIWPAFSIAYTLLLLYVARVLCKLLHMLGQNAGLTDSCRSEETRDHTAGDARYGSDVAVADAVKRFADHFESTMRERDQNFEAELERRDEAIVTLREQVQQLAKQVMDSANSWETVNKTDTSHASSTAAEAIPRRTEGAENAVADLAPEQLEDLNNRLGKLLSEGASSSRSFLETSPR